MSSAPKIFIIILNWNGGKDTLECLRSVGKIDYPEFEIVVVDNGSTDGSPGAIHETFREVTLLETGQNLGYAEGNNVGIRHALAGGAEYILLLNNDTVVDAQLVSQLVEAAAKHPTAGIYQPKIYFCSDPKRIWFSATRWVPSEGVFTREQEGEIDQGENGQVRPTDYACGCALVTTEVGAVRDCFIHGETALVSPPQQPELLAAHISFLLEHPRERARLALAASSATAHLTWERFAEHIEAILCGHQSVAAASDETHALSATREAARR